MYEHIIEFIYKLFDLSIYFIFMANLLDKRKLKVYKFPFLLLFLLLESAICFIPIINLNEFSSYIIELLLLGGALYMYFETEFIKFIVNFMITYFFIFIVQFIYIALTSLFLGNTINRILSIIACSLTLFVAILTAYFFDLRKINNSIYEQKNKSAFVLINIFTCSTIISFYFKMNIHSFTQSIIFIAIAVTLLIFFNIIIFNQFNTINSQNKKLEAYNQYMPLLDELIMSVRKRQHNHTNEIQALIGLIHTHNDYDSLTNAISETLDIFIENHEPDYLLKLNLLLVSGFLYQKQQYAISLGRNIIFNFKTYQLVSSVPEYVLIEMFGILIDNSLEAIPIGETVVITLDSKDGKTIFTTKNSGHQLTNDDYINFFTPGYSSKAEYAPNKEYSGIGLSRLRELVILQYKGKITLWNEDNNILVQITV